MCTVAYGRTCVLLLIDAHVYCRLNTPLPFPNPAAVAAAAAAAVSAAAAVAAAAATPFTFITNISYVTPPT